MAPTGAPRLVERRPTSLMLMPLTPPDGVLKTAPPIEFSRMWTVNEIPSSRSAPHCIHGHRTRKFGTVQLTQKAQWRIRVHDDVDLGSFPEALAPHDGG